MRYNFTLRDDHDIVGEKISFVKEMRSQDHGTLSTLSENDVPDLTSTQRVESRTDFVEHTQA